jgi:hypothetical protein
MTVSCTLGLHNWNGCKCIKCGKVRDEGHDWGKDCKKCERCGATRNNPARLNGCKCETGLEIGALFEACKKGSLDEVELLITKNANINTKDRNDNTPLHSAALNGHKEIVELLFAKGSIK